MKRIVILLLLVIVGFTAVGCRRSTPSDKPVVITTLFPQYDFVRQIAGDLVDLEFLLQPGTSAHAYEPSPATVIRILNADLLVYTGDGMEPWVKTLIASSASERLTILDLSVNAFRLEDDHNEAFEAFLYELDHIIHEWEDGDITAEAAMEEIEGLVHAFMSDSTIIPAIETFIAALDHIVHEWEDGDITAEAAMEEIEDLVHAFMQEEDHPHDDNDHGDFDPHIWLDPLNAKNMVRDIIEALVELLPEHEATIRANGQAYLAELEALHQSYLDLVANVEVLKIMHGGHNAFTYFTHRYNIQYVTPYRGFSSNAEPTPQALAEMIDLMNETGIEHLFSEHLISPNVANAIKEATGATILYLYAGENAPKDAFDRGITFIEMMQHNLEQFKIGMKYNG
ncbi:MAG: metal ABC transporter solute-binding protein, Zn/Mn family [Candidatus Izemoplasmataceae bacterium]|uniref:metal ABC transporter solute-binding protein, Zn/Mn family n=1 Tax=Liberiplasma polymorphum TaxID=3374570 RepID=UPI0037725576